MFFFKYEFYSNSLNLQHFFLKKCAFSKKNFKIKKVKNFAFKTEKQKSIIEFLNQNGIKFEQNLNMFLNFSFDKNRLKIFVLWFLKTYGQYKTVLLLEKLKEIGFGYATKAGASLGIDDLKIPPQKKDLLNEAQQKTITNEIQFKKSEITGIEYLQRFIDIWHQTSEMLKKEVVRYFEATDLLNPVYMMAFSGARGNLSQVRQLVGMRGLMADPQGKIIDFPIRSNFREGLTITEYVISTYGARKGIVDTALRTANAGYLTRRLVDVAQQVIVSKFDCETKKGILIFEMKEGTKTLYSLQTRLVGRILAEDIFLNQQKIASRNEEVSQDLAQVLAKLLKKVRIRSPLTCKTKKSVCQLCYGWNLTTNRLISMGDIVGVIAAQSIGEPGTQLTMRTFHTGGVFAAGISEQITAQHDGLIEYPFPLAGSCIRTPQGNIAFLTKSEGSLILNKFKDVETSINQNQNSMSDGFVVSVQVFKIPSYSLLFFRNKQKVYKKQIIAQFSSLASQQSQRGNAEQIIYSEYEGEIDQTDFLLTKKLNEYEDQILESSSWGSFWILSGKIYKIPTESQIFPIPGDWVGLNSTLNRIHWMFQESCFVNITKKEKEKSSLKFLNPQKIQDYKFPSFSFYNFRFLSAFNRNQKSKNLNPFLKFSYKKKIFNKKKLFLSPIFSKKNVEKINDFLKKKSKNSLANQSQFMKKNKVLLFYNQKIFTEKIKLKRNWNLNKLFLKQEFSKDLINNYQLYSISNIRQLQTKIPLKEQSPKTRQMIENFTKNLINWEYPFQKFFKKSYVWSIASTQDYPINKFKKNKNSIFRRTKRKTSKNYFKNLCLSKTNFQLYKHIIPYYKRVFFRKKTIKNKLLFNALYFLKNRISNNKEIKKNNKKVLILKNQKLQLRSYLQLDFRKTNPLFTLTRNKQKKYLNIKPEILSIYDFQSFYKNCYLPFYLKRKFLAQPEKNNLDLKKIIKTNFLFNWFSFTNKIQNYRLKTQPKQIVQKELNLKRLRSLNLKKNILVLNLKNISYQTNAYIFDINTNKNLLNLQRDKISYTFQLNQFKNWASHLTENTYQWEPLSKLFLEWFPKSLNFEHGGIFIFSDRLEHFSQSLDERLQNNPSQHTQKRIFYFKSFDDFNIFIKLSKLRQKHKKESEKSFFTYKSQIDVQKLNKTNKKHKIQKFLLIIKNSENFLNSHKQKFNFQKVSQTLKTYILNSLESLNTSPPTDQIKHWFFNEKKTKTTCFTNKIGLITKETNLLLVSKFFVQKQRRRNFWTRDLKTKFLFPIEKNNFTNKVRYSLKNKNRFRVQSLFFLNKPSFLAYGIFKTKQNFSQSKLLMTCFLRFKKTKLRFILLKTEILKKINFSKFSKFETIQKYSINDKTKHFIFGEPLREDCRKSSNNVLKNISVGQSFPNSFLPFSSSSNSFNSLFEKQSILKNEETGIQKKEEKNRDLQTKSFQLFESERVQNQFEHLRETKLLIKYYEIFWIPQEIYKLIYKSPVYFMPESFLTPYKNKKYFSQASPCLNLSLTNKQGLMKIFNSKLHGIAKMVYYPSLNNLNPKSTNQLKFLSSYFLSKNKIVKKSSSFSNSLSQLKTKKHNQPIFCKHHFYCNPALSFSKFFVKKRVFDKKCLILKKKNQKYHTQLQTNQINVSLQIQEGWVYIPLQWNQYKITVNPLDKEKKNLHQSIFNAGKIIIDDICFEKNKVYTKYIALKEKNMDEKKRILEIQRISKTPSFLKKINVRIQNSKCRFMSSEYFQPNKEKEKTLDIFSKIHQKRNILMFLPMQHKILPNIQIYNRILYNSDKSKTQSFFSSLTRKFFHSYVLNKQKLDTKVISTYPGVQLNFSLNWKVPVSKKKIQKNLLNSGFWNFKRFKSENFMDQFNLKKKKKLLSGWLEQQNSSFIQSKNLQIFLNKKRKKKENSLNNSQNHFKGQYNFCFVSNSPLTLSLKIKLLVPKNMYYSLNGIQANLMTQSYQKRSKLRGHYFSLSKENFCSLKSNLLDNNTYMNSSKNSKNLKSVFNPMVFANFFAKDSISKLFKISLIRKIAFLANQRLITSYFINQDLKNNLKLNSSSTILPFLNFPILKNKFRFLAVLEDYKPIKHFSIMDFSNLAIFRHQNFVYTSFLSPFTGEILPSLRNNNNWVKNLNQNQFLFLTEKDLFSVPLFQNSKNFVSKSLTFKQNIKQLHGFFLELETFFERKYKPNVFVLKEILISYQEKLYKVKNLRIGMPSPYRPLRIGSFLNYGNVISSPGTLFSFEEKNKSNPIYGLDQPGQVIHMNSKKITLRTVQIVSVAPKGIFHASNGQFIQKNIPIITLPFQTLKTGDIVQGIPKVEQYFEARTSKAGRLFFDSLPNLLRDLFERYRTFLPLKNAVNQSTLEIQQIIIDGIHRVYRSQGVGIIDKHLEVIIRQMTSKVRIIKFGSSYGSFSTFSSFPHSSHKVKGAHTKSFQSPRSRPKREKEWETRDAKEGILTTGPTGFFPGELFDLDLLEDEFLSQLLILKKVTYEPTVLGITRISLEVQSFLSASSFQQTTKILTKAAICRKKDFLKGLKENLMTANLIPGGTAYLNYSSKLFTAFILKYENNE